MQHDAAGSGRTVQALAESLIGSHPVLAVELPGHGDSDNTIGEGDVSVADYREALVKVLDVLGLDRVNGYGVWGGGSALLDLAIAHPGRVARLVITGLIDHTPEEQEDLLANYAPEITPRWHGGHLLEAWHMMRDQGIYFPWYSRTASSMLKGEPYLDPEMVHRRVVEVLRAPVMWRKAYHAHFRYRTGQRLADAGIPVLLATAEWDVARDLSERLAAEYTHCDSMLLPDNPAQWGAAVTPFLQGSRMMTSESTLKPFSPGDVFVGATLLNDPDDDHAGRGRIIQYDAGLVEKGVLWIDDSTHLVGGLKIDPNGVLWAFDSNAHLV